MKRAYKFLMRPTVGQPAALGEKYSTTVALQPPLQERRDA